MAYGSLNTDIIQSSTTGVAPQFNDGAGIQTGTLCRAWASFTGSTGVIRGSFNVSSITRAGAGQYTANFTNALPDTNYSAVAMMPYQNGSVPYANALTTQTLNTTSYVFAGTGTNNGGAYDPSIVSFAIFR